MELLERDELLRGLREMALAAAAGNGRVVVIEGESGIGKTSVLRALAQAPEAPRALWGACDALATPRPLGPLGDMARRGASTTAEQMAAGAPAHAVFDAFLTDLATPTLAIFEDLHWADEATLDLLRFAGRRIGSTPSLLLGTLRDDEVGADHPLRAVLGDLATTGMVRLRIDPLSAQGVRALAAGHAVDPDQLHQATGGNPFYVTEVLAQPGSAVPPSVRDAVLTRIQRLPAGTRDVLETVSVEPGSVGRALLRALDIEDRTVDDALRAAVLVDDGRGLRFRHELARLAVEASLTAERARDLHQRLLAALEDEPGADPARLAHHAAAVGDRAAQLRWSRAAADAAMRASAHSQAADHYAAATQHLDLLPPDEASSVLAAYAEALVAVDQPARAVDAWERVSELLRASDDKIGFWSARAQLARAMWTAGRSAEAYALIDATVAALEEPARKSGDGRVAEAFALAAYLAMLARRSSDAVARAQRAIGVATSTGARAAIPLAYNALGSARIIGFEDLGGITDLERSGSIADELGDRRSVVGAHSNTGSALGEIRRYDDGAAALERAIDYAAAHDFDFAGRYALAWLGRIRFEQGRWAEAAAIAAEAIGDRASSPISPMVALVVLGRVRARTGAPDARTPLDEAWAIAQSTNDLQRTWPAIAGLAEAAWLEAWPADEVNMVADRLGAVHRDARRLRLPWAIGELAFWLDRLGRGPVGGGGAATPFAAWLAGDHRAAADAWEAIGCPYEAAWALADTNEEPALREALDRLMSLGADPLATRVRRTLRSLGATGIPRGPRLSTARSPSGLTAREAEVLALLAEGLTDREIADRLVVSPKTASHHVSAILAKLGVQRRTAAAAAARDLEAASKREER